MKIGTAKRTGKSGTFRFDMSTEQKPKIKRAGNTTHKEVIKIIENVEKRMEQKGDFTLIATEIIDCEGLHQCTNCGKVINEASQKVEQKGWEQDFRATYEGANVWSSKSIDDVIQTINNLLLSQRKELIKEFEGVIGEEVNYADLSPYYGASEGEVLQTIIENKFRAELRQKLSQMKR